MPRSSSAELYAGRCELPGGNEVHRLQWRRVPGGPHSRFRKGVRRKLPSISTRLSRFSPTRPGPAQFCGDYASSQQWDDALNTCTQAIDLNPMVGELQVYARAAVYRELDRNEEALAEFQKVLEARSPP